MSISVHFTANSTEVGSLIIAKLLEPLCNLVAPVVLILRTSRRNAKEFSFCRKLWYSNPYIFL